MTSKWVQILTIINAGIVMALALHFALGWSYPSGFILGSLLAATTGFALMRYISNAVPTSEFGKHWISFVEGIKSLPREVAKEGALQLLGDTNVFRTLAADPDPQGLHPSTPPSVRELFSSFSEIDEVNGNLRLSMDLLGPVSYAEGLLRIGNDTDAYEIAFSGSSEVIFVLDGSTSTPDHSNTESYPTVYHFVLSRDPEWEARFIAGGS